MEAIKSYIMQYVQWFCVTGTQKSGKRSYGIKVKPICFTSTCTSCICVTDQFIGPKGQKNYANPHEIEDETKLSCVNPRSVFFLTMLVFDCVFQGCDEYVLAIPGIT